MNANLTLDWLGSLALRGAVLLAVVLAVGLLLRRVSAGQRYGLWLAALLGLIGLPALLSWGPAWRVLPNFGSEPFPITEERAELIDWEPIVMPTTPRVVEPPPPTRLPAPSVMEPTVTPTANTPAPPFDWLALIAWLPLLWFFGVTAGLAGLFVSLGRLRRLRGKQPQTELASLHEIAHELGLHRTPRLVLGAPDAVPMVWGVWHPCLLLPQGFQDWPQAKLRAVLLHELAHLVRRDPLALWLGQFARVLHWFNPLAWLTLNQMRADQERACDDTVLRHGVRASDYAQVLLDLSQQRRPVAGLSLCALAMARPGPVEQRLVAILDGKCPRASATRSWRFLWTALILTVALPLALLHAVESAKVRGQIVDRNGVVLAKTKADGLRVYPQKDLAAHVVGYVSINRVKDNAIVGSDGIEKSFHETLSKGTEVRLTLDARLQRRAEVELQTSQQNGAVVIVDVATGEILALASWPSYDLNHAVPIFELAVFQKWAKDPAKPLFPRATFAQYPPGGPFKAVTALAGLSAGHGTEVFHCEPQLKIGERYFHNHSKSDIGEFDLERAIVRSHNVYFYQLALKMGHEPLAVMAAKLGFGEKTGLPLATEATGNIPAFLLTDNRQGKSITGGDIANLSIGQGETLATPVQMARMAALIASRGKSPGLVLVQGETGLPATDLGVSPEDWDLLHRAMRCDVPRSVSGRGASEHVSIAMMTGTSQWNIRENKNLAQVIGFAPVENPQVAFAVVLEGRPGQSMSGGDMAAPMAKRIVEQYLGLPLNRDSPPKATQPPQKPLPSSEPNQVPDILALAASNPVKGFFNVRGKTVMYGVSNGKDDLRTEYNVDAIFGNNRLPYAVRYHPCKMKWEDGAGDFAEEFRSFAVTEDCAYNVIDHIGYSFKDGSEKKSKKNPYSRAEIWSTPPEDLVPNPLALGHSFSPHYLKLFDKIDLWGAIAKLSAGLRIEYPLENSMPNISPLEVKFKYQDNAKDLVLVFEVDRLTEKLTFIKDTQGSLMLKERVRQWKRDTQVVREKTYSIEEAVNISGIYYPVKATMVEMRSGKISIKTIYQATVSMITPKEFAERLPVIPEGYAVTDHRSGLQPGESPEKMVRSIRERLNRVD